MEKKRVDETGIVVRRQGQAGVGSCAREMENLELSDGSGMVGQQGRFRAHTTG